MKNNLLLLFILICNLAIASNYNGNNMSFKQGDGTTVDLKLFGSEYYARAEGIDGYTVVREKTTNNICYAKLSEDGSELISTGILYHAKQNSVSTPNSILQFKKHLDINIKAKQKIIASNQNFLSGNKSSVEKNDLTSGGTNTTLTTPFYPVSGNIRGICIVVDFSDEPSVVPMTEFDNFCNDINYTGYGNNGSLRSFYSDISGGIVDYQNVVFGYFRAPLTFADYDAMPYAVGAQQILGLALHWIDSMGFDFSTLSLNADNSIKAINLMYTGNPPTWAQGMWHHKGNYTGFSADGVTSNDYNCSPANSPLKLAVVAHENGHMICHWPDTYKYDNTTGPDGIGSFDLMCWYGDYYNPTVPNPMFLANSGWKTVIDVTNFNGINTDTANSLTCYRYTNINDTNEFFLLANRLKTGRSTFIDDEGLTIWHIDRNGDNQTLHHEVYLDHANNDIYDHTGACFKNAFNIEFSENTIPNSSFYNGDPSGLRVWDIGNTGQLMNYKLGNGFASASLNILYQNISNDNNSNGFLEPGETGDLNLEALNNGQVTSGIATFTCAATGANANFITINTPSLNVGTINVAQSIPEAFNVTIDPAAPLGTEITLQYILTDGTDTVHITRTLVVGVIDLMNNQLSTTCSSVFFDAGGPNNYSDNTDFTKTFMPATAGSSIVADFSFFDLEAEPACGYDYLYIYNGPTAFGQLVGSYCGTNSPGIITSTHNSGALTFKFHADGGVTGGGWRATMTCNSPTEINSITLNSAIHISPNPSTGKIFISIDKIENVKLEIADVVGKILFTKKLNSENNLSVDLADQPNGIYTIRFTSTSETRTERLLLNR